MFALTVADQNLNVSPAARAILALLSTREPEFLPFNHDARMFEGELHTRTVYNGRERGYAIVVVRSFKTDPAKKTFVKNRTTLFGIVFFAENRNSDDIFVQTCLTDTLADNFNLVVTYENLGERSYRERKYFNAEHLIAAANHVVQKLAFYAAMNEDELRSLWASQGKGGGVE